MTEVDKAGTIDALKTQLHMFRSIAALSESDLQTISDHVLKMITVMSRSEFGFYGFLNADQTEMTIHSWSGKAMAQCGIHDRPETFPIAESGLWAEAVRKRRPLIVNDYDRSHPAKRGLPQGHVTLKNLLVLPFLRNDKIISVAAVANRREPFSEEDADKINMFLTGVQSIVDSRRSQEELKKSERTFKTLIASITDVVMRFDREYRHIFASNNVLAVTGMPASEILDKTHRELGFAEEQCTFWEKAIESVFKTGKLLEKEFTLEGPEGDIVFDWRLFPEKDETGEIVSVFSLSRDITARRKAERNYQTLFHEMLDGFAHHEIVCDGQGKPVDYRFIEVNPAFERMTGLCADEIRGKTVLEVMPDTEPHGIEIYAKVALTGEPTHFEQFSSALNRHFEVKAFQTVHGCFACIFTDITPRVEGFRDVRASEEKFRALIEQSSEMLFLHDTEGRLLEVNPATVRGTGYSRDELLTMTVFDLDPGALRRGDQQRFWKGLKPGDPPIRFEVHHQRKDGTSYDAEVALSKIVIDDRHRMLGLARDISERKQAEQEKIRLQAQMHKMQKLESLGLLAGGVAHDFNNILLAILGNADIAREHLPATSPARKHLDAMERAAKRAVKICGQMLDYSGQGPVEVEQIDLIQVVRDILDILKASVSKKIELHLDMPDDLPLIKGDPAQVSQLILNLAINASEAIGDRPGAVALRARHGAFEKEGLAAFQLGSPIAAGRFVVLEVADDGPGMNEATRPQIFDPFFSTKSTGRGLGLSAVLGIMRGHKGGMKVDSSPGKGTTFTALFPAISPVRTDPLDGKIGPTVRFRATGTALLADDEPDLLDVLGTILQGIGLDVITAEDGRAALEKYREHRERISCVILDLTMPNMDGREVLEEIRREAADLPVLLCSGFAEKTLPAAVTRDRRTGFLHKPYRKRELIEALSRLFEETPRSPHEP